MKKLVATLAAMVIALLGLTGLASSAQADSSYPPPVNLQLTLKLNINTVTSGGKFVATATTTAPCDKLAIDWSSQHAEAPGSQVVHTFTAPTVTKSTVIPATATCTYGTTGTTGHAIAPAAQIATASENVTVLPASGGALPNTGGPSSAWLIGGILALVAGAGAMVFGSKRRAGAAS